jgi:hypothetical protein
MLGASAPANKPQPTFTAAELFFLFLFFIFKFQKLRERATTLSRLKIILGNPVATTCRSSGGAAAPPYHD